MDRNKGPFHYNVLVTKREVGEGRIRLTDDIMMSRLYTADTQVEALEKAKEAALKIIRGYEKDFTTDDVIFQMRWEMSSMNGGRIHYRIPAKKFKYNYEDRPQQEMSIYVSLLIPEPDITDTKTFKVTSGSLVLSDPCYEREAWCALYDLAACSGTWHCGVKFSDEGMWGNRVAEIWAVHEGMLKQPNLNHVRLGGNFSNLAEWLEGLPWTKIQGTVGVDSGQAGIFDSIVPVGEGKHGGGEEGSFYRDVCDITLGEESWGVWNNQGCVSRSGFGDGGYNAYGVYLEDEDKYRLIGVRIAFIEDLPEEDEEEAAEEEVAAVN